MVNIYLIGESHENPDEEIIDGFLVTPFGEINVVSTMHLYSNPCINIRQRIIVGAAGIVRDIFEYFFDDKGFTNYSFADSAKEVIQTYSTRSYRPATIFAETRMPDMSGVDLARRLREIEMSPEIYAVCTQKEQQTINKSYIDDFLTPDFSYSELMCVLGYRPVQELQKKGFAFIGSQKSLESAWQYAIDKHVPYRFYSTTDDAMHNEDRLLIFFIEHEFSNIDWLRVKNR